MSQTTTTAEDIVTSDEQDEYRWYVAEDGWHIAKVAYETYELGYDGITVTFDDVRESDDEGVYELRDGYDTQGTFDTNEPKVPAQIVMIFDILVEEL